MTTKQPSCDERLQEHLTGRIKDLQTLWALESSGSEDGDPDLGTLNEYGLGFDYVPAKTFRDEQDEGYFRYQLSWGGPSDEFRFFVDADYAVHRIEYWFLDWFDGAHRVLRGAQRDLLDNIWDYLTISGDAEYIRGLIQQATR